MRDLGGHRLQQIGRIDAQRSRRAVRGSTLAASPFSAPEEVEAMAQRFQASGANLAAARLVDAAGNQVAVWDKSEYDGARVWG